MEDSLPELCTGPHQNYGSPAQPSHLIDAIKEAVNETVSDILAPLMSKLSHLMTPGYTLPPARRYWSWPQTLPQDSTGSEEQTMKRDTATVTLPNTCTVTWRGAAMV